MPDAASATYPGVDPSTLLTFSGTESIDAQPGRFVLGVSAAATPAVTGDLVFTDGTRTITIPACRVIDARWSGGGQYQITLEDRRWRWRTGIIFGRYNVPRENGAGVDYEKTPRELAELLWATMNESDLDVTLLPNDARPAVDWYGANPADELIALLALLGCVLAPQLDGGWKVYPIGSGAVYEFPAGSQLSTDVAQDFALYPDSISVVTGPIQYEACFALEAVGEETDGSILPIDQLSYTPSWGWEQEDNDFEGIDSTYTKDGKTLNTRDLARSCVRRWYRVASMPAGTGANSLNPPGYPATLPHVEELRQLLPLVPVVNETYASMSDPNFGKRMPAEVWGRFVKDEQTGFVTRPGTRVAESFSIDAERGIVKFGQPVFRYRPVPRSGINSAVAVVQRVDGNEITIAPGTFELRDFELELEVPTVAYKQTGDTVSPGDDIALEYDAGEGFWLLEKDNTTEAAPAYLFLRCVVEVQQPEINIAAGYQKTVTTGLNNGTGAELVTVDDLELQWRPVWKADGTLDPLDEGAEYPNNREDVDAEADYYLNAKLAGYQTQTGGTVRLGGIHAPNLNGLQTSVSWSFGVGQAPTTTIGVASRANPYLPDYRQQQAQKLTKSQQLKKERRQRLKARGLFRGQP